MKPTSLAPAFALLSASSAATVTLTTTPCLDPDVPLQQLTIEMNLSGPVARDLPAVCGLRILSASDGIDINTITCQAFKDVVGTQPGSAKFTYAEPARIATNSVPEKAIWCTYPVTNNVKRQLNETTTLVASSTPARSRSTVLVSSETSSVDARSTVTSMVVVTPSAGVSSASGNATSVTSVMTRPTPSQTSEPPRDTPGAAADVRVGLGVGVVAAAVVAMFA